MISISRIGILYLYIAPELEISIPMHIQKKGTVFSRCEKLWKRRDETKIFQKQLDAKRRETNFAQKMEANE